MRGPLSADRTSHTATYRGCAEVRRRKLTLCTSCTSTQIISAVATNSVAESQGGNDAHRQPDYAHATALGQQSKGRRIQHSRQHGTDGRTQTEIRMNWDLLGSGICRVGQQSQGLAYCCILLHKQDWPMCTPGRRAGAAPHV